MIPGDEASGAARRTGGLKFFVKFGRVPMLTSVIGWMLFGLVAGAVARFLHPGYDRMGMVGTIILGILGSVLGGGVAYLLRLGTSPYQPGGWILSIIGAILLLWMGVLGTRTRPIY